MNNIIFKPADKSIPLIKRQIVRKLIHKLFASEEYEFLLISYIFCSDKYLLKLNQQYLNHNFYTDILTFLISKKNQPIESEIYISTDRIKENAKNFKVKYQTELLRVMIHGALHLCGYDDTNRKVKEQMQQREDFYIQLYNDSRET
jgi:probable rRNA maturation factor